MNNIEHTKTKSASPQTNGICERFHKTILQEFYQVAFRRRLYLTLKELQDDLDEWLHYYNHQRTDQGKLWQNTHRNPDYRKGDLERKN